MLPNISSASCWTGPAIARACPIAPPPPHRLIAPVLAFKILFNVESFMSDESLRAAAKPKRTRDQNPRQLSGRRDGANLYDDERFRAWELKVRESTSNKQRRRVLPNTHHHNVAWMSAVSLSSQMMVC